MKNIIKLSTIFICLLFVGCGTIIQQSETTNTSTKSYETTTLIEATPYMIKHNGHIYLDTGETNSLPRCGVMDLILEYTGSLDKLPTKENEANFNSEGCQASWRENRIEVLIDDTWHIFAYNENNIENVKISVLNNTNSSATLEITNDSDEEIQYGEEFTLEKKNNKTGEWFIIYPTIDDYAFNEIAYIVKKNNASIKQINLEWLYGKLDTGTYRIVKTISKSSKTNNKLENHWYSAEFLVTK